MKYFALFFLLVLRLHGVAFSQYDSLLHKSYAEKLNGYSSLYLELIALQDSAAIARKTEEVREFARRHKDKELEMEMDIFTVYHNIQFKKHRSDRCISDLKRLIAQAEKEGIRHLKIRAIRVLAEYYWFELKNFELAFEQYLVQEKEIDKISVDDYPEKPRDLMKIGEAYYFFQDYSRAKAYFKKAIKLPENDFNTMFINSARNTLGLCYQKEKKYDLSDYYFNQIVQTRFDKPKQEWVRIATGNLGANYYYRKEYDKAIPLLEHDFEGAVEVADYGPAAGAAILLADIYLHKEDMKLSWYYISNARINIEKAGQPDRLQFWYPVVSKWFGANGNEKEAGIYLDSTTRAINEYHEKFSALKVLRAQQKINSRETELRKTEFALERQKKMNERNILITVVIGLGAVMVLGYFVQKRRQQATEIEKLKIEGELKKAQDEIDLFIYKINEQSKITERFSSELEKLKNSESDERKLLEKTVAELRSSRILTEDDWISFQTHFAKIFPAFTEKLKDNYPAITGAEARYLMLSKLRLSHKEMAQALGISPDAVRVTWNRVRKKLGGTLEDTPQSLVESLG